MPTTRAFLSFFFLSRLLPDNCIEERSLVFVLFSRKFCVYRFTCMASEQEVIRLCGLERLVDQFPGVHILSAPSWRLASQRAGISEVSAPSETSAHLPPSARGQHLCAPVSLPSRRRGASAVGCPNSSRHGRALAPGSTGFTFARLVVSVAESRATRFPLAGMSPRRQTARLHCLFSLEEGCGTETSTLVVGAPAGSGPRCGMRRAAADCPATRSSVSVPFNHSCGAAFLIFPSWLARC